MIGGVNAKMCRLTQPSISQASSDINRGQGAVVVQTSASNPGTSNVQVLWWPMYCWDYAFRRVAIILPSQIEIMYLRAPLLKFAPINLVTTYTLMCRYFRPQLILKEW